MLHENEEKNAMNKEKKRTNESIESFSPFTLQTLTDIRRSLSFRYGVCVWLIYFDFIEVDFLPKHNQTQRKAIRSMNECAI